MRLYVAQRVVRWIDRWSRANFPALLNVDRNWEREDYIGVVQCAQWARLFVCLGPCVPRALCERLSLWHG